MQNSGSPTRVYCPEPVAARFERFISGAFGLEERDYDYELHPLVPGSRVAIRKDFEVEAFETEHPVPSLGYHLWRRRGHLAAEFAGLDPSEIVRLRTGGAEVTAYVEELLLSYCGDTGPAVFDREPRLFEATVLLLETTYVGPELRARGVEFGHTHVDDLIELQDRFKNQAVLLHHLSRRHRPQDLRRAVDERLPTLADRVRIWGEFS